jgi:hypothetical protein
MFKRLPCRGTLLCLFLLAPALYAQIRSGTITGTVQDQSGAIIADAEILVTDTGTNITFPAKTTQAGLYTVPYLAAGTYSVSITKIGFESYQASGVHVDSSETVRIDAKLQVGSTGTKVDVVAAVETLQTDSSNVAGAVNAQVIDAIPNVTQNPLYYAMLQNGVQPRNETASSTGVSTYNNSFGIGVAGRAQFSAVGVNGGRAFTNDVQLDGLPIMGGGFNEAAIVPNTEGLQEVRVISNNFTADYGHGQSVISMSTKSGTNQFHGEANYLLRNEALNANTNTNNALSLPRPAFKVNQFGGAFSGPIIKNKLFFFSSYHRLMFNQGVNYLSTVPTDLERIGNFSKTFIKSATGSPIPAQIYNPFGVTQLGSDLYQRAAYPNATIPTPNPYAVHMLSFYPEPNRTPLDVYNTSNYASSVVNTVRTNTLNNRIDYKQGMHSIYGSGGFDFGNITQPRPFGTKGFNDAPEITSDHNPYGQIGDTVVLSPTLFVDMRYGITRINTDNIAGNRTGFTDYASFGIPSNLLPLMAIPGAAPIVQPNNYTGGSGGGSNWTGLSSGQFVNKEERQISHALNTSITKVRGNWTHKAGVEARVLLSNYEDFEEASAELGWCCGNVGGNYTFQYVTANGSSAPQNTSPAQAGVNGAAMLAGLNTWVIRPGENERPALAAKYFAVYSQNDWKVSRRLTLNLGLRWDLQPAPTERYNRISAYDFSQKNPYGTLGAIAFPGTDGYSRNLWNTEYHDFGPRIGGAYQAAYGFVLRGGFGITYLPSNTGYYSSATDYGTSSFAGGTNMIPYGTSPNGVPVRTFSDPADLILPTGSNIMAPQLYGGSNTLFSRNLKNGMAKQANFFVEKALGANGQWLLSAGYSGSYSTHLANSYNFQSMQNIPSTTLNSWLGQYVASNGATNPANVQVQNPWQPATGALLPFVGTLAGRTIPQFVTMLPYPLLYGSGAAQNQSNGFATYNSLQVRVSHAFSSGLHLDLNYTWSKELDYTDTVIEDGQGVNSGGTVGNPDLLNPQNNRRYGLSDQPNRFVGVLVYESPFGKGKSWALSNRIARGALGNWSLGSVITLQSGMPFVVSGANTGALTGGTNRVPGVSLTVPSNLQHWYDGKTTVTLPCGLKVTPAVNTFLKYNACAFSGEVVTTPNGSIAPNQFWVGSSNETSGDLRGPGRFNVDLSLRRTFSVTERLKLEIAANASNLLNNTQLNGAYTGALGSTNLANNPSAGLIPGYGTGSTFGTISNATFDPRQITMQVKVVF